MERWATRVLGDPEVPTANRLSVPALEDHIPELIERLVRRLQRHPPVAWGEDGGREVGAATVGVAHAEHRFHVDYALSEALRELSHFRAAVVELCAEQEVELNAEERMLLHMTIDEMMRTSASEFERRSVSEYETAMGVIAHDLRSPLNAISLFASGLEAGHFADDPAKGGAMLRRNVRFMERLVEDLLVYSRIEAGHFSVHPTEVDMGALVGETCESFQHAAHRRRIDLSVALPDEGVTAFCDRDRISQVLANLIGNALKFTPEGGSIRVALEPRADSCAIRVHDTGPGIDPEHAENVFRPFWRAPGAAPNGAGLGLAIARAIVEAHGGEVAVESRAPPGATLVLTVPYRGEPRPTVSIRPGHGI